jgi:uncharacterized protein (DUF305 family)
MQRLTMPRIGAALLITVLALLLVSPMAGLKGSAALGHHHATPPADPCANMADMATPDHGMAGHDMGSPMAGMEMGQTSSPEAMAEFDQLYIDMMIPHHASIIAMAEAALPRLTDERLREIAQAIIATQEPEIAELRDLRQRFYGSPDPAHMDMTTMTMMDRSMPGMGTMEDMAFQMDSEAQVAAICAAENVDLAFIDLTIPHHEMAITGSEAALERAVHPEIRDIAERVIAAQQREIETLTEIRRDLTGEASPAADTVSHGGPIVDQVGFIDALRAEGLTVDVVDSVEQPFLQAPGTVLRLSGNGLTDPVEVQVFDYADASDAEADAAAIGPDGQPRTALVEWIAPPHFYRADGLIVLYVGDDHSILELLSELLGPPFAG